MTQHISTLLEKTLKFHLKWLKITKFILDEPYKSHDVPSDLQYIDKIAWLEDIPPLSMGIEPYIPNIPETLNQSTHCHLDIVVHEDMFVISCSFYSNIKIHAENTEEVLPR